MMVTCIEVKKLIIAGKILVLHGLDQSKDAVALGRVFAESTSFCTICLIVILVSACASSIKFWFLTDCWGTEVLAIVWALVTTVGIPI